MNAALGLNLEYQTPHAQMITKPSLLFVLILKANKEILT